MLLIALLLHDSTAFIFCNSLEKWFWLFEPFSFQSLRCSHLYVHDCFPFKISTIILYHDDCPIYGLLAISVPCFLVLDMVSSLILEYI